MKKIVIAIVLILCLSCCSGKYSGWQNIDMHEIGSIKVPQGWEYHRIGDTMFFTEKNITEPSEENTYMVGVINGDESEGFTEYKVFDKNAEYIRDLSSAIFSNDTYIAKAEYVIYGELCEKVYLKLQVSSDDDVEIMSWNKKVDYETVKKIAESFRRTDA